MLIENLQNCFKGQYYRLKQAGHKAWIFAIKYSREQWLYVQPVILTDGWTFIGKDGIEQYNIDYRNRWGPECVTFLRDIEFGHGVEKITERKYNELLDMFTSSTKSFLTICTKGMN